MNSGATTCGSSSATPARSSPTLASRRGQPGTLTQEARPRGHRPRGARGARDRSAGLRARVQRLRDESLLSGEVRGDTSECAVRVEERGSRPRSCSVHPDVPEAPMHSLQGRAILAALLIAPAVHAQDDHAGGVQAPPPPPGSTRAVSARASALLSNVVGGGTDAVPGLGGVTFRPGAGNTHFDRVYAHPTGHWVLTAFADLPSDRDECLIRSGARRARRFGGPLDPGAPNSAARSTSVARSVRAAGSPSRPTPRGPSTTTGS